MTDWAAAFAALVTAEERRTLVCHPTEVADIYALLARHGQTGRFDVRASPVVEPGQVWMVDEQAMEAGLAELRQHARRAATGET